MNTSDPEYRNRMYELLSNCKSGLEFALQDLEEFEESGTRIKDTILNIEYALSNAEKLKSYWDHDKVHTCPCCGQYK